MRKRVAIVTGGGRGIGYEVCRQLGMLGFKVILTSPDRASGRGAAEKLSGDDINFYHLDITNEKHILGLRKYIIENFGRIDVLVNNAGVMFDLGRSKIEGKILSKFKVIPKRMDYGQGPGILGVDMDIIRVTLEINTLGALRMCQVFVPLMIKQKYGRVVNVSSSLGQLKDMGDEDKVPAYQISKTALNAVTRLMASASMGKGVLVNSVCPGWTRTGIGGKNAPQSVKQAAGTIIWLARLPEKGPTGSFFRNKRRIAW